MRKYLLVLFGITVLAGLISQVPKPELLYDSTEYFQYAQNWVSSGVYGLSPGVPDAHREPAYGIFLGLVKALFGHDLTAESLLSLYVFVQSFFFLSCAYFCATILISEKRWRWGFFALCALSPTFLGAHRFIFSESLAASLIMLVLTFLATRRFGLAGVFFGLVCMTKYYLVPLAALLFLAGLIVAARKKRGIASKLIMFSGLALAFIGAWSVRNQVSLPKEPGCSRLILGVGGKIGKYEALSFRELPAALTMSMYSTGSLACANKYGGEICGKYDFPTSDRYGSVLCSQYVNAFSNVVLLKQVLMQGLMSPLKYLLGTGLEMVKMVFFEYDHDFFGAVSQDWAKRLRLYGLWHFIGSLVQWVGFILGTREFLRKRLVLDSRLRIAMLSALALVGYHVIVMSQLTNVDRYMVPIIPAIYLLSTYGFSTVAKCRRWPYPFS